MFFAMAGKMDRWNGETNAQYSWPRSPLGMKMARCLKSQPRPFSVMVNSSQALPETFISALRRRR